MELKVWVGVETWDANGSVLAAKPIWLEVFDLQGQLLLQGDPMEVRPSESGMYILQYTYPNGARKSLKVFVR
jgi:hypothetical protein